MGAIPDIGLVIIPILFVLCVSYFTVSVLLKQIKTSIDDNNRRNVCRKLHQDDFKKIDSKVQEIIDSFKSVSESLKERNKNENNISNFKIPEMAIDSIEYFKFIYDCIRVSIVRIRSNGMCESYNSETIKFFTPLIPYFGCAIEDIINHVITQKLINVFNLKDIKFDNLNTSYMSKFIFFEELNAYAKVSVIFEYSVDSKELLYYNFFIYNYESISELSTPETYEVVKCVESNNVKANMLKLYDIKTQSISNILDSNYIFQDFSKTRTLL